MAIFTVTYANGDQEVLIADGYRKSREWLQFTAGNGSVRRVRAEAVRRIDSPGATLPSPGQTCRLVGGPLLGYGGLALFFVGMMDAIQAEMVFDKMLGSLLVVAGVVLLVGSYTLLFRNRDYLHLAMLGALVAVLVSSVASIFLLLKGGEPVVTAILAGATLGAVFLFVSLYRAKVRPNVPSAFWGAAAVPLVVGLLPFLFDKAYEPATRGARLTAVVELTASSVRESATLPDFVTATVTLKNVSGTRVRVLGSHYNFWNFEPGKKDVPTFIRSRDLDRTGFVMGPDQEVTKTLVMRIPDHSSPAIGFDVEFHVAKDARMPHGDSTNCRDVGCLGAWELQQPSLVKQLIFEPRYLVLVRHGTAVNTTGEPGTEEQLTSMDSCISRSANSCRIDRNTDLDGPYGLEVVKASAHMAL